MAVWSFRYKLWVQNTRNTGGNISPMHRCVLANILPDISHILRLSFLPLFYPYVRYLGLIQIYRLNPTVRTLHPITTLTRIPSQSHSFAILESGLKSSQIMSWGCDSLCVTAGEYQMEYWSSKLYSQKSSAKLYSENPPTDKFLTVGIYLQNNTELVLHLSNPRL